MNIHTGRKVEISTSARKALVLTEVEKWKYLLLWETNLF